LAIIALTAFAACLEGYLFAPLRLWQRALIVPAGVAVFWPDLMVEAAGVVILIVVLTMNWMQSRRDGSTAPV
jgi:TRAP-type uncharacterized transport system fused permease subunit